MKRAIATFGTGKCEAMQAIALPSYQAFADRHGYDLFTTAEVGTERPPSWYAVPMLQKLLADYDEVLWLDADTVIVDGREDMQVPPEYWQAIVNQYTYEGEIPNIGVWFVRKPMIPVLEQMWGMDRYVSHCWWDNAAVMDLMGYDPNRRPVIAGETTELRERTFKLNNAWNTTRIDQWSVYPPRIRHVASVESDVLGAMKRWAEEAEGWING